VVVGARAAPIRMVSHVRGYYIKALTEASWRLSDVLAQGFSRPIDAAIGLASRPPRQDGR
jgi:hypothetical protein